MNSPVLVFNVCRKLILSKTSLVCSFLLPCLPGLLLERNIRNIDKEPKIFWMISLKVVRAEANCSSKLHGHVLWNDTIVWTNFSFHTSQWSQQC